MEQPLASEDHRDDDSDLVTTLNLKFMLPECVVFPAVVLGEQQHAKRDSEFAVMDNSFCILRDLLSLCLLVII